MSFGENLRLMRKARNLTQEQFAEALGVSRQAVSKWEADSGYPEAEKLIVISRVLGVSVDKLLDIEPEQDQTENEDLIGGAGPACGYRRGRHSHHDFR